VSDINECSRPTGNGTNQCNTTSTTCVNEPGSYSCRCLPGFYAPAGSRSCNGTFVLLLGRPEPPFRTGLCFTRDASSFFVSPLVLRAPSTDRPETLPHGRNLAECYNPTPKIRGKG